MHSAPRPYTRAACAALLYLAIVLAALLTGSRSSNAHAASIGQLQRQISAGKAQVSSLSGAVRAASGRVGALNSSIASLEGQIARIQAKLDADRAELLKLQSEYAAAQVRLTQLENYQAHAESVLAAQLVNSYESDRPDLISVVLDSTGFQDLLERLAFAQRIQKQDVQIVSDVRAARRAVAAQAIRLGQLQSQEQRLTVDVLSQRNSLDATKLNLVQQEVVAAHARDAKAGQLSNAQGHLADLQHQLSQLQAAQAAAAAAQAAARDHSSGSGSSGSSSFVSAGQVSSGGGFVFPMPRGDAVGPGSWSEDQGVDIAAPGGTPELAVCSGTIVLHGIGGFGPWAPVLHCDSPVGGYSYVYYGHAGPANQLPIGTHVGAGQVMSEVGPGIVGISTGPHLEIGFADSSGSPIGGGSAATMMSLLQGAYGG